MMPTVWTSTRYDAELQTYRGFGVDVLSQLIQGENQPVAIRINQGIDAANLQLLKNYSGFVVLDLNSHEMNNGSAIYPNSDVLILSTYEAELILNRKIDSHHDMQEAANRLLAFGTKSVFLLGKQTHESSLSHDYWTNSRLSFWLTQDQFRKHQDCRAVFSAAITASLALGYPLEDAIIIAAMYVHQANRLAKTSLYFGGFPEDEIDLPYLSSIPLYHQPQQFKPCQRLGLYPIVDSPDWVEMLLKLGVKTIQLRIKDRTKALEKDIKRSITLAKKFQATLFINDYWELALKLNAEAVHLGQSDLDTADIDAIRKKDLLLGVSTHCYYEVARAHAISPSYLAIGPIYPTTSKEMPFSAQGVASLHRWQRTLRYPLVAIGGINLERMPDVVATGVQGVALISAITQAKDPRQATEQFLNLFG